MEGGSQAQDHGQAIHAKIQYSVSSTFATGCSGRFESSRVRVTEGKITVNV